MGKIAQVFNSESHLNPESWDPKESFYFPYFIMPPRESVPDIIITIIYYY